MTFPPRRAGALLLPLALPLVIVLGLFTAAPASAAPAVPAAGTGQVDLADPEATPVTRSIFGYLRDLGDAGVLFGHQEDLYFGESFDHQDGTSSDVLTATGDHPAVIGFDTLERVGMSAAERQEKAALLATNIRQAHDVGAISTLTIHMENLATGKDFYDTAGDPLRAVLPGGSHHGDLRAYLDRIAYTAQHAVDAAGEPIPIIFRPWHENAGSWFWWGAANGSPGEYKELFRFTVEYLRDVKDVHNLLYAFSPGGGFAGDAERYLRTYPGDEFVDVLGIDTYDDTGASEAYVSGLVADLAMISEEAVPRGKISALTEFGINGGVRPDGQNKSTTWYTALLNAIKADPSARRIAFMLTWANYGGDTTPYTPVEGELLPDFQAFHADPFTFFADDLTGVYDRTTEAVPSATAHLVSPAAGSRVVSGPASLRASVTGHDADRVVVTADPATGGAAVELTPPADGEMWWTGSWDIPESALDNATHTLTLTVHAGGTVVHQEDVPVVLGPEPQLPRGVVDDFESYGDDEALRGAYVQNNANTISLERAGDGGSVGSGEQAMRLDYSFANQSYTGVGRQVDADWSGFWELEAWIDPDRSANKMVLQLVAGGVAYEAYPSLAGDEPYLATIPFADWRPAPWDTANADRRITQEDLRQVTQFNVFVNAAEGGAESGSIVVDDLRAVEGAPPAATYSDVPSTHEQYAAIEWLHSVEDLGDESGRFHPDRVLHRGEWTDLLEAFAPDTDVDVLDRSRAALLKLAAAETLWALAGSPASEGTATYDDVPAGSAEAVAWVVSTGLMSPASAEFGSEDEVTRAEAASLLHAFDQLPEPLDPVMLFDFESGAQGWAMGGGQTNGGTVSAAEGKLVVEAGAGGSWVGSFGSWDLSGRRQVDIELAETTGSEVRLALQLGGSWTWCETASSARVVEPGTVALDLTTLSADCQDLLGEVRGINVHLDEGRHALGSVGVR